MIDDIQSRVGGVKLNFILWKTFSFCILDKLVQILGSRPTRGSGFLFYEASAEAP